VVESRLFAHLAQRGLHRRLAGLDVSVHRLPRARGAAARRASQHQHLEPARLYNLSRVEGFYRHRTNDIVLIPVFAGVMDARAAVRHSAEHDRAEWLTPPDATARFSWPRERRALDDVLSILGSGDAGLLEDVLRVC